MCGYPSALHSSYKMFIELWPRKNKVNKEVYDVSLQAPTFFFLSPEQTFSFFPFILKIILVK